MAKRKKKKPLTHHVNRVVNITPKFVHGMVVGAFVGAMLVALLRVVFPAYALSDASIQDCSANAILTCGTASPSKFISDVKSGKPNGDLAMVYKQFGLDSSDYDNFAKNAKMGSDLRNGDVVVNGKTVMTGAWSIGREYISGTTKYYINGHLYYRGPNNITYARGVNSIQVMVLFNSQGVMQFGVMTPCGNPVGGTPVKPKPTPTPTPTPKPKPKPKPTPTPTPTPIPTTTVTPAAQVTQLPNTGPGAVIIIAIVSVIGGYAAHMTHRHIKHRRRHAAHHRPAHAHSSR